MVLSTTTTLFRIDNLLLNPINAIIIVCIMQDVQQMLSSVMSAMMYSGILHFILQKIKKKNTEFLEKKIINVNSMKGKKVLNYHPLQLC